MSDYMKESRKKEELKRQERIRNKKIKLADALLNLLDAIHDLSKDIYISK